MDRALIEAGGTARLARFTAALRYEDLPPAVAADAKRVILDTIASAIGGQTLEAGRACAKGDPWTEASRLADALLDLEHVGDVSSGLSNRLA
jgi:hypothetical protein